MRRVQEEHEDRVRRDPSEVEYRAVQAGHDFGKLLNRQCLRNSDSSIPSLMGSERLWATQQIPNVLVFLLDRGSVQGLVVRLGIRCDCRGGRPPFSGLLGELSHGGRSQAHPRRRGMALRRAGSYSRSWC